jgi:caffeoyl-CoA O-methyltransferase
VERETNELPMAGMLTRPDQAALLTLLVRLTNARTAIEIGTFTGYGAICIARGLPADGRLTIFEVSEEYAAIARRNLEDAGQIDKVEFVLGPASLDDLDAIDFAYVDADKDGYPAYYDAIVPKLRAGGLLLLDNMLRGGRVIDGDPAARVTAELNDRIASDERVDSVLLGLRDGLTIVTPRAA